MAQWKKGESGNPSGRPKTSFKKVLEEKLHTPVPKDYLSRTSWEVIVDKLTHKARLGTRWAIELIATYTIAKPPQTNVNLELTREERIKQLEELMETFPALPEANEHTGSKPN